MISKTLVFMVPLVIAAMGGLLTELAGVLNIALEGLILIGAFTAILVAEMTGSITMGILGAVLAATIIAYVFSFSSLKLKGNIFVTGLAINLLTPSLISIISDHVYGTRGAIRLSDILITQNALEATILTISVTLVIWLTLTHTPFGLHLRTAGTDKEYLLYRGINADKVQRNVILLSGAACGLSGALISLSLGVFIPGISAGKGWIALVAVYLGNKKPFPVLIACFLFALAEAFSDAAQGFIEIPATIILSFPYLITIIGLTVFSILRKN